MWKKFIIIELVSLISLTYPYINFKKYIFFDETFPSEIVFVQRVIEQKLIWQKYETILVSSEGRYKPQIVWYFPVLWLLCTP